MTDPESPKPAPVSSVAALTLGALGIVYGDIGTSPLYALRECFHMHHEIPLQADSLLGVLSLILWSLVLVVTVKYLSFVMRADNRGEGGILALMALAEGKSERSRAGRMSWVVVLGLFGAALLYGDAILTPAISVLSAVEGLEIATPVFKPYIVAITVAIIAGVFLVQRHGTHRIGRFFGPVMVVWFASLAVLGIGGIRQAPEVLQAINPVHAARFLSHYSWQGFTVLGSVFLAVTGGEALYADMGHFGRRPIQLGWYFVALPALVIHYFGQGALLLTDPSAIENPFYHLAPDWARLPLVGLATAATVIASQAMLTGAFSLSHQAIQLGFLPKLEVVHTSPEERHQIYVPSANWFLFLGTLAIVVAFGSSSRLAAAYGIAVTGTMVITTLLTCAVAIRRWRWPPALAYAVTALFLIPDLAFLGANSLKFLHGGWLPVLFGSCVFLVMTTWKRGRALLAARKEGLSMTRERFLKDVAPRVRLRVPGNAVFMTEVREMAPSALVHNVRHNQVIHECVVLFTVDTADVPHLPRKERLDFKDLGGGFCRIVACYGFMDSPDIPEALADAQAEHGFLRAPAEETTYFFSNDTVVPTDFPGMAIWREHLFAFIARNARRSSLYFKIPSGSVVQLGEVVDL